MKNANIILNHPLTQKLYEKLDKLEDKRIYCIHDLSHSLDVARICYILNLENNLNIDKDIIYSTAILHDLGRVYEYENIKDHHIASVDIARKILESTDFKQDDKEKIIDAIKNHRNKNQDDLFNKIFYKADKLSRDCFNCRSQNSCRWSREKMNLKLVY